jgi:hypothetical protein
MATSNAECESQQRWCNNDIQAPLGVHFLDTLRPLPPSRRPPKATPKPGTCEVQAMCLGGDWEVQARYMRGTSHANAGGKRGDRGARGEPSGAQYCLFTLHTVC